MAILQERGRGRVEVEDEKVDIKGEILNIKKLLAKRLDNNLLCGNDCVFKCFVFHTADTRVSRQVSRIKWKSLEFVSTRDTEMNGNNIYFNITLDCF